MLTALNAVTVLGIDPGLSGGIAVMTSDRGVVKVIPMPIVKKTVRGKKKRELNLPMIIEYLQYFAGDVYTCAIEQVHAMPKQGVTSMFNFGLGYGQLLGILATLKIPCVHVPPTVWKKSILAGTERDKAAAIAYCQKRYPKDKYPTCSLIPKGCRTPHDGMADALCLAEYARKQLLLGD